MFIFRVAGCGQNAFPRALDNSLGQFQLPGIDPILFIHFPLSVSSAVTCNLQAGWGDALLPEIPLSKTASRFL